jgi:hypothetical protein
VSSYMGMAGPESRSWVPLRSLGWFCVFTSGRPRSCAGP